MTSVEIAVREFVIACQADGLSRSTVEWYQSILGRFVGLHGGDQLREVGAAAMRRYLVGLRRAYDAESTVSAHTRALHRFWKWATVEYRIENPMRTIRYPQPVTPVPRAASLDDLRAMFAAAEGTPNASRDRSILALLLDTGARAGGLVTLRADSVDLEKGRAIVTEKGGKSRAVRFTAPTAQELRAWLDQRAPVATLYYNLETLEPLTRNGLYQLLRRMARRAGVAGRFNPHSLRHTFAREYIQAGGDVVTLSRLLGHRDVSTTVNHYAIFTDDELARSHEKYSPAGRLNGDQSG